MKEFSKMNLKSLKYLSVFLLLLAFVFIEIKAEGGGDRKNTRLNKISGQPVYKKFNINNISTFFKNDGESDINPNGNSGLEFPKGSGKTAIFQAGFLWGGKVNDQIRVGGSVYRQGTVPGKILNSGVPASQLIAENPDADNVRIYRVRPDIIPPDGPRGTGYSEGDVTSEVNDEGAAASDIINEYYRDWREWPGADGAPYTDVNANGVYDYQVDIPGFPGADQTLWFVSNDTDPNQSQFMYGSLPMGIEQQVTVWGYNRTGALGNMLFRKYKIINKSDATFEDMYVSMWNDPDLGDASDDFSGCDTVLSMTYVYNANATDQIYGRYPAAAGFDFFQGPIVESPGDSAIFDGRYVQGYTNLPMTAHYFFINPDAVYRDPTQGQYQGTLEWYNFMQGRVGTTGDIFPIPSQLGGGSTPFALAGDPVARTGWVDGLQHPPGDRRAGMASGPFNMAPGDTQEVVVAEIVAGGFEPVDRLSAVALLKFYDLSAQFAYDNFFNIPPPPPPPQVTAVALNNEIVLDWSKNPVAFNATENYDNAGFKFEGYNVYQLPTPSATKEQAKLLATFDLVNGVGKIFDLVFDVATGTVNERVVQFGNDFGIQRYFKITTDAFGAGAPLNNGSRYYFAVTAYAFNDELAANNNLENTFIPLTVVPQSPDPGVTYGEGTGTELPIIHLAGTADGGPTVTIIDPTKTTGHEYEVYFTERAEIRNENGDWVAASTMKRQFNPFDPDTLTGSSVDISAMYAPQAGVIELSCYFNYVSSDGNWADGIEMDFPPGMTIVDFPAFEAGGGTITPEITGDPTSGYHIVMGVVDGSMSEDGIFHGGEEWSIFVASFDPPQSIGWEIWDDGWSGGVVNAVGTTTVEEIGYATRLAKYWNLRDVTANVIVLENQSVLAGTDIFPARDDIATNPGLSADPIVDGFQISVDVGYAAPINFLSTELIADPTGQTTLSSNSTNANLDIQNYTIFSGVVSSKAIDNFGVGTNVLEDLQQDYEYRFTGVYSETSPGIFEVTSGGQMATVFTMLNAAALANHPMNPSPGTAQPFLIRIPFEVWNVDDPANPYQINMTFRDRERNGTERPFYAWNPIQRMYAIIVNSPYDENQVIQVSGGPDQFNDPATWVTVHYGTNYGLGAVVKITYANPIQIGLDTYRFTTTGPTYSSDQAKQDVDKINVFPNPYYGVNSQEINKYERFVTFNHLPETATIRIFNLAGQLIRTIDKNSASQYQRWDLATDSGLPVASGLYVVYVDMPDLGTTKILKAAIIQEQQILDRF